MIRPRFSSAPAAAVSLLLLLVPGARPLRAVDLFYTELLRDGNHAYDRGDFAAAARALRLACFGMLDEPKALGACLARLALAQDKVSDVEGFRETFVRLVEVEDRFQGFSQADLPAEIRAAMAQRVAARIPASTLESSPQAFRIARKPPAGGAAQSPAQAQAKPPVRDTPAQSPNSRTPAEAPAPTAAAPARPPAAPATKPPSPAPSPIAKGTPPPGPRPLTDEEKAKLESVRKALGETGKGKELRQVFQTAREVADAHPESADAQRLAGEAAYRVSRWSDAASYLRRGGGPPDSEPELLFYLAVSLYESGDAPGAAAALRRSLPNLQRSPYVDAYARKILGQ
jgi:tetratricopeptide (TPR) repeat protein